MGMQWDMLGDVSPSWYVSTLLDIGWPKLAGEPKMKMDVIREYEDQLMWWWSSDTLKSLAWMEGKHPPVSSCPWQERWEVHEGFIGVSIARKITELIIVYFPARRVWWNRRVNPAGKIIEWHCPWPRLMISWKSQVSMALGLGFVFGSCICSFFLCHMSLVLLVVLFIFRLETTYPSIIVEDVPTLDCECRLSPRVFRVSDSVFIPIVHGLTGLTPFQSAFHHQIHQVEIKQNH